MLKKKIKILAIDLDGTLTNFRNKISSINKKALIKVQKQGIKVIIITGRSLKNSLEIAKKIELDKYNGEIIFFSGAATYNLQSKKITNIKNIPQNTLNNFCNNPQTHQVSTILINKNFQYFCLRKNFLIFMIAFFLSIKIKKICSTQLKKETFINGYMLGRKKKLVQISNDPQNKKLNFCFAKNVFCEFNATSKGKSLEQWIEKNNYKKEEVMVFGNGENDYSLFKIFKYSIAVANAISELKKIAFDCTEHWNKDGIAKSIEKYLY